jgi:hypothetical protein
MSDRCANGTCGAWPDLRADGHGWDSISRWWHHSTYHGSRDLRRAEAVRKRHLRAVDPKPRPSERRRTPGQIRRTPR